MLLRWITNTLLGKSSRKKRIAKRVENELNSNRVKIF